MAGRHRVDIEVGIVGVSAIAHHCVTKETNVGNCTIEGVALNLE